MQVFHYHPVTHVFLGSSPADESPLEPGVFLIPAHATVEEPPAEVPDEFDLVWSGNSWGFRDKSVPPDEGEVTPEPHVTAEMVTAERDRRINAGFEFRGVRYQSNSEDRENILGAYSAALTAIMNGAQPGNLTWNPTTNGQPFVWIALDNSLVPMDAPTVIEFGEAAAGHKQAHIMAARALKNQMPIPLEFKDDIYWP